MRWGTRVLVGSDRSDRLIDRIYKAGANILYTGATIVGVASIAHAENLHRKYRDLGMEKWDCSYIVITDPRYPACKGCEDKGMEYNDSEGGSCEAAESLRDRTRRAFGMPPRSRDETPRKKSNGGTHAPKVRYQYGALAYGKMKNPDGTETGVTGYARMTNQAEADGAAVSACIGNGGKGCSVVGVFSGGRCGYIVLCANRSGVSYGAAETDAAAAAKCFGGNYTKRDRGVGGCTDK
jgi:hypothetical protein